MNELKIIILFAVFCFMFFGSACGWVVAYRQYKERKAAAVKGREGAT